jgi:hypothetical protein
VRFEWDDEKAEEETLLKPGRDKMKRGGFMARHPKMKPQERKRA